MININQAGVGYYLHREGLNLGKNIVSLVSCYHPALTHSSGPPTRAPPVLTPTRGVLFLSPEDMQEAKKSMNEKGIKAEDVKNLPPIEEIHGLNLPPVEETYDLNPLPIEQPPSLDNLTQVVKLNSLYR